MTTTSALPHWDMSVVYPSMESAEFEQGFAGVVGEIADLATLFDTLCYWEAVVSGGGWRGD